MRIKWSIFVKFRIPYTHGCFVPNFNYLVDLAEWFWRKRYFKLGKWILAMPLLSLLGKRHGLHLHKRAIPSPKDALCQVWLKLAQWFWKIIFFNLSNVFSLFRNYLPMEKGMAHLLQKLESPLSKDALCQVWLKLTKWFWRKWKCEKFKGRWTDRRRTTDHPKSSIELSA